MIRAWFGAIAILLALSLVGLSRDQSVVFQACVSKQASSYNAQKEIKGSPDIVVPVLQRWPITFQCTGTFLDTNNPAITAVATIIIAIFTIVLTAVTGRQARLTKDALIADKRAFVFPIAVNGLWEEDTTSGGYNWRLTPVWRNSGDTPTKDLRMHVQAELRNTRLPPKFNFRYTTEEVGFGLMAPHFDITGGQAPKTPTAAISPQDIKDIQAGKKHLYLWGWAKYRDVFEGTPVHNTRFCWAISFVGDPFIYNPLATAGQPGTLVISNFLHPEGNNADETD